MLNQGQFKWSDNKIFKGEWKNNTLTGFGIYIQPDKVYKGYFYNDMKHGYGMYIYENDSYLIGRWIEDVMQGLAIFYETDKTEELIIFKKNREKRVVKGIIEIEDLKKSSEYQNLLVFLEEINNHTVFKI